MKQGIFFIILVGTLVACNVKNKSFTDEKFVKTDAGYVYSKYNGSLYYQYLLSPKKDTVCKIIQDTVSYKVILDTGKTHLLSHIWGGIDKNGKQFLECSVTSLNIKGQQKALAIYEELPSIAPENYPYIDGCPIEGHEGSIRVLFKDKKESRRLVFLLAYAYERKEGEELKIAKRYSITLEFKWKDQ